ncbi:hypothetical protein ABHN03_16530 [Paenibacillus sp. NRS-1775]|uniref:hypothetical protein n=1 Tax=unclassified Paenibacillus TaxID=185978 RepID=UPI003D27B65B
MKILYIITFIAVLLSGCSLNEKVDSTPKLSDVKTSPDLNVAEHTSTNSDGSINEKVVEEKEEPLESPQEKKSRWKRINTAMENGEYTIVAENTILYKDLDAESSALYNYANYHISGQGGEEYSMMEYLGNIPPGYNGKYSDIIREEKLDYKTMEEWEEEWEENKKIEAAVAEQMSKPVPTIGMTSSEVIDSRWGRPQDVNRTTTEFGTSEQWVYSGYRYVYLEDGVVTAIQD